MKASRAAELQSVADAAYASFCEEANGRLCALPQPGCPRSAARCLGGQCVDVSDGLQNSSWCGVDGEETWSGLVTSLASALAFCETAADCAAFEVSGPCFDGCAITAESRTTDAAQIIGYYDGWAAACEQVGLACTRAVVSCDTVEPACVDGRCVDASRT